MCYESRDVESIVEQSEPVEGNLSQAIEPVYEFQSNNLLESRDFAEQISENGLLKVEKPESGNSFDLLEEGFTENQR